MLRLAELLTHPEIAQDDVPGPGDEHVAALHVPVHDAQAMHVLQGHAQLRGPILHLAARQLQLLPRQELFDSHLSGYTSNYAAYIL